MNKNDPSSAIAQLFSELNRLYDCLALDDLLAFARKILMQAIACDIVNWYHLDQNLRILDYDPQIKALIRKRILSKDALQPAINRHPFVQYFISGGEVPILRLSDLIPPKTSQHPTMRLLESAWHAQYVLGTRLTLHGHKWIVFSIKKRTCDFEETDLSIVKEIMLHVTRKAHSLGLTRPADLLPAGSNPDRCQKALRGIFALTAREAETAYWVSTGKTNIDIGCIMGISPNTIRTHLQTIFKKMEVHTRAELSRTIWLLSG
jgi:DNA-binding CsgD family transcriptional regulator